MVNLKPRGDLRNQLQRPELIVVPRSGASKHLEHTSQSRDSGKQKLPNAGNSPGESVLSSTWFTFILLSLNADYKTALSTKDRCESLQYAVLRDRSPDADKSTAAAALCALRVYGWS